MLFLLLRVLLPTTSHYRQLRSVLKQDLRNLPRVLMHDPRSGDASINPRSGKDCPQFWAKSGGSCYKVHRSITSFKEAEDKCKADNKSVVKITTPEENRFVKSYLLHEEIPKVWIGMTKASTRTTVNL